MSRIYEIFGTNAHAMTRALMESAGAACKIPSGASVALKPNLVVAASPETGATTHAGVLSGAIEYLRDHGFRDISIIEGSWVGDDTGRAFRAAGYEAVGKKYGVPLFDLKRDKTRRVDTPLRPMDICCRALDADYLINLPVLKGHCQTAMTCALKNCKGCLPDREKRRFHAEGLMRPIAALAAQNAEPEDIARLEAILLEVEVLIRSRRDYAEMDSRFHAQIAACSHNAVMSNLVPVITDGVRVFASAVRETEYDQTLASHRAIFEAIRDRRALDAGQAMYYHLMYNQNRYANEWNTD